MGSYSCKKKNLLRDKFPHKHRNLDEKLLKCHENDCLLSAHINIYTPLPTGYVHRDPLTYIPIYNTTINSLPHNPDF